MLRTPVCFRILSTSLTSVSIFSVCCYSRYLSRWWPLLAYIPSWWKNQPSLVRVGAHAHPLSLYPPSRAKLWCTLQLKGQILSPYFSSTHICTLWYMLYKWRTSQYRVCCSYLYFINLPTYRWFRENGRFLSKIYFPRESFWQFSLKKVFRRKFSHSFLNSFNKSHGNVCNYF